MDISIFLSFTVLVPLFGGGGSGWVGSGLCIGRTDEDDTDALFVWRTTVVG